MRAVFDTNILVDYLNGIQDAAQELARYSDPTISRITWMETLVGARDERELEGTREFLRLFRVSELGEEIAEEAVRIRQAKRIRLPDAIVLATAVCHGCRLVTRNTKDFDANDPVIRVPYSVEHL